MKSRALHTSISVLLLSILAFSQSDLRRLPGMQNSGSVVVNVRDGNGRPIADARVELRDRQLNQVAKAGYTNPSGTVEVVGVPVGVYDLVVTKGLNQVIESVDIRSTGMPVNIQLANLADAEAGGQRSVSVAQYKVPGKARKECEKARKAMNDRKVEEAEAHIAKALAIHPKYSEALTLRAILKMDRGDLSGAGADVAEALQYDPTNATAYLVSGANLNQQSQFDLAIETLERGITLDPLAWQGYFELGKAHVGKKNYPQAIKYLDKAQATVNFDYPPVHLVKAHALLALKDYSQAMAELQVFLDKSPVDPRSADARKTLEEVRAFVQR